jgi:uncharacterized protein YlxW (UPF0749 family)
MKKNRVIFYIIFALFHIGAFIFTVALGNNSSFLMSMFSWVPYFKWVTLLGVIMVAVDFIWTSIEVRNRNNEKAALSHEVNTLKAKLFDMQEDVTKRASGSTPGASSTPSSPTPPPQP